MFALGPVDGMVDDRWTGSVFPLPGEEGIPASILSIPARDSKLSTVFLSVAKSAFAAGGRTIITTSDDDLRGILGEISRSWRFSRFLTTALPTFLLTEKPKRDTGRPLGMARKTSKGDAWELPLR